MDVLSACVLIGRSTPLAGTGGQSFVLVLMLVCHQNNHC